MLKVPFYDDVSYMHPENFVYPYSDKYMTYDKYRHQYFLTEAALDEYGVDTSELNTPEKVKEFISTVTRAVYSYIQIKAGKLNYPAMMYRIAKSFGSPKLDYYAFRKIFLEDVLIVTAKDISMYGYAKDTPKVIVNEYGKTKTNNLANNDGYWLHDDVITTLDTLNLTSHQRIIGEINWSEY